MMNIYAVRTNAYDMIVVDEEDRRRVWYGTTEDPLPHAASDTDEAALLKAWVSDLLAYGDWSSWEEFDESAKDLIGDATVLFTRYWFAVQRSSEDAWDDGSWYWDEAVEMLRSQGEGLIAVIDEASGTCEEEYSYDDLF